MIALIARRATRTKNETRFAKQGDGGIVAKLRKGGRTWGRLNTSRVAWYAWALE